MERYQAVGQTDFQARTFPHCVCIGINPSRNPKILRCNTVGHAAAQPTVHDAALDRAAAKTDKQLVALGRSEAARLGMTQARAAPDRGAAQDPPTR